MKFLYINYDLDIQQNYFKRIILKISEIYPANSNENFIQMEKILNILKRFLKAESLNDLCDYYKNVY